MIAFKKWLMAVTVLSQYASSPAAPLEFNPIEAAPHSQLAEIANDLVELGAEDLVELVELRREQLAVATKQFVQSTDRMRVSGAPGDVLTTKYFDHRGVSLASLSFTVGEGAPHDPTGRRDAIGRSRPRRPVKLPAAFKGGGPRGL
mmetsp:Transcript_28567/g.71907  ORF Transcript_28567/g.71907 Transcript_28567/m.71907 type:complete len:146 (+) Transcript_28567:117-554(+)